VCFVETPKEEKKEMTRYERLIESMNKPGYIELLSPDEREAVENPKTIKLPEIRDCEYNCWWCGKRVVRKQRIAAQMRVYCSDDCSNKRKEQKEKDLETYVNLKIKVMHERALRMLEKQGANLGLYYDVSQAVLDKALSDYGKFQSSHEMVAAMELIRNKIQTKVQATVNKNRVDFMLPELCVVLEIDGYMHKYKVGNDSKRDVAIRNELGPEWEVVRIPTKYIEQNIKMLVPAIEQIYGLKQKFRAENNGFLPDNYSEREKAQYRKMVDKLNQ
jgi:very-short-patch-repair endonuclease